MKNYILKEIGEIFENWKYQERFLNVTYWNIKNFVLKWYERDRFLPYYDQLKYKEFSDNLVILLLDVQVVNFDFMHHQRRGDSLQGSVQNHKAVSKRNFKRYLKQTKTKAVIAALKNYWVI